MQIILDEGYQFGLGVFETISIEHNVPVFLSWHLERLRHSLRELGIRQNIDESYVCSWLSAHPGEHQALKIMASDENLILTIRPNPYTPEQIAAGFSLSYSHVFRNETSPLTRHKTLNYGDCILEKRRAREKGADELILCNSRGEICEGTTTNIFFVRHGQIYTPPVSCGLLPGILRRFILEQYPVNEQILYREDALQMEECFVTNSLMGVMPVNTLGWKRYPSRTITQACIDAYRKVLPCQSASGRCS